MFQNHVLSSTNGFKGQVLILPTPKVHHANDDLCLTVLGLLFK